MHNSIVASIDRYITAHRTGTISVLRDGQFDTMIKIREFVESGQLAGYLQLPTGWGKTVLFTELVEALDVRTLIAVPTIKILKQTLRKFEIHAPSMSIGQVSGTKKQPGRQVAVITYPSLIQGVKSGLIDPSTFGLLVLDEAHRALGANTKATIERFAQTLKLGLTATPAFGPKKHVNQLLPTLIHKVSMNESVAMGILCPFSVYLVKTDVDISEVRVVSNGDYDPEDLDRAINIESRNLGAVDLYSNLFSGHQAVFYCNSVSHAGAMATTLTKAGIPAEAISGQCSQIDQKAIFDRFESGETMILCNAKILVEGFDAPYASVCINLKPTRSRVDAEQRGGRALRVDENTPDKHAYVVDFLDSAGSAKSPILFSEVVDEEWQHHESNVTEKTSQANEVDGGIFHPELEISGLKVITDPQEVLSLTRKVVKLRTEESDIPEGWLTASAWAIKLGLSDGGVRSRVAAAINEHPGLIQEQGYFKTIQRSAVLHYSPQMIEAISDETVNLSARYSPPPDGWMTVSKWAESLRIGDAALRSQITIVRSQQPEYEQELGSFDTPRHRSILHCSPKLVEAAIRRMQSQAPPDWKSINTVANHSRLTYHEVSSRVKALINLLPTSVCNAHCRRFSKGDQIATYVSPEMTLLLTNVASTIPRGYDTAGGWSKRMVYQGFTVEAMVQHLATIVLMDAAHWFSQLVLYVPNHEQRVARTKHSLYLSEDLAEEAASQWLNSLPEEPALKERKEKDTGRP